MRKFLPKSKKPVGIVVAIDNDIDSKKIFLFGEDGEGGFELSGKVQLCKWRPPRPCEIVLVTVKPL